MISEPIQKLLSCSFSQLRLPHSLLNLEINAARLPVNRVDLGKWMFWILLVKSLNIGQMVFGIKLALLRTVRVFVK
jgi:hypothetical protein